MCVCVDFDSFRFQMTSNRPALTHTLGSMQSQYDYLFFVLMLYVCFFFHFIFNDFQGKYRKIKFNFFFSSTISSFQFRFVGFLWMLCVYDFWLEHYEYVCLLFSYLFTTYIYRSIWTMRVMVCPEGPKESFDFRFSFSLYISNVKLNDSIRLMTGLCKTENHSYDHYCFCQLQYSK